MTATPDKTRDAARTKREILEAAQQIFSTRGFAEAGVREITALAKVNPALVSRYFGSKLRLYEAALHAALDVKLLTDIDKSDFGRAVVARFVASSLERVNPLPMLVFGAADSDARDVALRLLNERVLEPLRHWFDAPDAEERAARIMMIATGFFTYRILLPLGPFEGEIAPGTRAWLERSLQEVVDAG